jgi:hypothetical protein
MLGKGAASGKFTSAEVWTTYLISTSTGSGIRFASGCMITIFPGRKTSESPNRPFLDRRRLPSRTSTLMYRFGTYSIMIVVPVIAAVTAAV